VNFEWDEEKSESNKRKHGMISIRRARKKEAALYEEEVAG
jgi:uncharacterized DUF497 family protein